MLDASQPASFLRDTVFGGNQFLYDMTSMVTDIVFDVVSGKALMKAARGGKLISKFQQIKGTFGTAFTEWGKGLLKTDSKVVKKIAGTLLGATSGALLITATDFTLMDVCAPLKVQRKYNSTNKQEVMLGQAWRFTYEGRLYKDGNRLHAALCEENRGNKDQTDDRAQCYKETYNRQLQEGARNDTKKGDVGCKE